MWTHPISPTWTDSVSARPMSALALALLAACADGRISAPADAPSATERVTIAPSITASDITLATLPVPSGLDVTPSGVGEAGHIFGNGHTSGSDVTQPYAWSPPFDQPPTQLTPEGSTTAGFAAPRAHVNRHGDATGQMNGEGGVWLADATAPGVWTFTRASMGEYRYGTLGGINDARAFVGWGSAGTVRVGFFWSAPDADPERLDAPSVPGTISVLGVSELNNANVVVGYVGYTQTISKRNVRSYRRAVVWTRTPEGAWSASLLPARSDDDVAFDINDAGWIAGNSNGAAVLWRPGTDGSYGEPTVVAPSQGMLSQIDRCGRIIGYTSGSQRRPWLWDNGALVYLPLPSGAQGGGAQAIATPEAGSGIVVGYGEQKGNKPRIPVRWTIPGCPATSN